MSNATPFVLGLGGGAALWYATKRKTALPPTLPTSASKSPQPQKPATARRNCAVHVERAGITIDGARVDLPEAVRRCAVADTTTITVEPSASASTCAALATALESANIPVQRNARRRNASEQPGREVSSTFTLVVFPEGVWGSTKRVRYFKANPPTTWEDARDRLAAAKILDRNALSPNGAGAWRLVTDPARFRTDRVEPLPEATRRGAANTKKRYALEGRTILRDGEAIARLDRVDLGDQRYALSPHETDRLAERLVRLLNQHGAR